MATLVTVHVRCHPADEGVLLTSQIAYVQATPSRGLGMTQIEMRDASWISKTGSADCVPPAQASRRDANAGKPEATVVVLQVRADIVRRGIR